MGTLDYKEEINKRIRILRIRILEERLEEYQKYIDINHKEIKRLNNKLLLIKGIINTPRALDNSLAYAVVKTQIEEVLKCDIGIDLGVDKK